MTVTKVDSSSGALLLKEGKILKQVETFSLVCVYNISDIHVASLKLLELFLRTKAFETHTTPEAQHHSYKEQIVHTFSLIDDKMLFLSPHSRVKRGLINGLGSVVKAITGNLDNDDAVKIEQEIYKLKHNIADLSTRQKHSVVLAEKTISDFNKHLQAVVNNQIKLGAALLNTTTSSKATLTQLHFLNIYVQLDFSLQIILDTLMLLEDAITFSQLGVMHPSIIKPQNLIHEMLQLQRNYSLIPITNININNIHQIERSIEVKAYSTAQTLTFILDIPSVATQAYDLIHIYSIPSPLNLTVIPKSKFLALGSEEYAYLGGNCRRINDDLQLCKQLETKNIKEAKDCMLSLLNHEEANCTYARMNLKRGKLQKLTPTSWLAILPRDELLRSLCNARTDYRQLNGVYIISLSEQCQVKIMNRTLTSHSSAVITHDVIPLPPEQISTPEDIHYNLQLEDINLDDLQQLINNVAEMKIEPDIDNWTAIATTPSWPTLLLYALGAALLSWKLYRYFNRKQQYPTQTTVVTPESTTPKDAGSCGARFYLKEGGVTMA